MFADDDDRTYAVVRNEAGDHSIWPADRAAPDRWQALPVTGPKADCLEHIRRTWIPSWDRR